jgi:hypothetical protein
MKNTLALIGAAVVVFLGLGLYLGWYTFKREPASPGHTRLQVDINQDKIGKDVKTGADKVKEAIDKAQKDYDKNNPTPSTSTSAKPAATPSDPVKTPRTEDRFFDSLFDDLFKKNEKKN